MSDPSVEKIVREHAARSLAELQDPVLRAKWASGERAQEQAIEIVSEMLAAAKAKLETENKNDASE